MGIIHSGFPTQQVNSLKKNGNNNGKSYTGEKLVDSKVGQNPTTENQKGGQNPTTENQKGGQDPTCRNCAEFLVGQNPTRDNQERGQKPWPNRS